MTKKKNEGINPKDLIGAKKPDFTLFPPAGVYYGTLAMTDGAVKYGPYNWRNNKKKVQSRTYIAASLRHLYSYLEGEDHASDSGVHHLGHAIATIAILLDAIDGGYVIDNRASPGPVPRLIEDYANATKKT